MRQEGTARSAPQPKVISFPPRKTRSIEPAPFPPASVPHGDDRTPVGRDFESKQLLTKLDDLADSRGFVQHILGDAGIGKTRLAEGTARVAAELGIERILVTITHDSGLAAAVAVGESAAP